ncbi:MAG: hypothetical protein ABIO63_09970 [Casimicrobiaceae bacterium]
MPRRLRKASTCVTLVLIGAAAVSGCSDPPPSRKAAYASRQECLADWGDEKECDEQVARRDDGSRSHIYWGPSFRSPSRIGGGGSSSTSRSSSSGRSSSSSSSTSRGGFGSHGSSSAS